MESNRRRWRRRRRRRRLRLEGRESNEIAEIFGGILGFYLMHPGELKYKEMWNERLKKYEEELKMKQDMETHTPTEFSGDSLAR